MAIEVTRPRQPPLWPEQRRQLLWLRSLAALALAFCMLGAGLGVLRVARVTAGLGAEAMAVMLFAIGAIAGGVAVAVRWAHTALAGRLDILSQALDASPDAQLIIAPRGRMVYANTAFNGLFPGIGEAPLDRIGQAVADDPEAQEDFRRLRSQAAAGARAIAALFLHDAQGGGAGWFNISVHPIAGRPGYSFWNFQDITARHEMEGVIHDERNKLVDFLDNAPIGFYSVDGTGRFLLVNRSLSEWLGATPAQMIGGAHLHDFLCEPPAGAAPWDPFGGADAAVQRGEIVLKGHQGRIVHAWIGQSVVGSGAELRTRSVVRDLTPEREWETARERFHRFFTNAPVGIALLDAEGRIEEANRAVGLLLDLPAQALIGQELSGFIIPEDRAEMAARLLTAGGPAPREPLEVRLLRPRERSLAVFLSPLDETRGGEGGLIVHFIDVTEQKNLQIQFAQSQKMQAVGQLAGGVAHDFNNLLTAMIGFCDLLLLRCRPGDPSFADVMQIKQNANRAANLVRQLLAFSRQQTLQPRVLDITDVLVELSHLLRRLIGENIELQVVHGRELGLAKVDQGQLEQVIINLAVNARDAMPQGGTLTIRTGNMTHKEPVRRGHEVMPPGDYLSIEVADTGVGIPKENLERIFEPFFSTKEIGSGTGLGLSTVYGIVKQTGGFVFVDSTQGLGTVFHILLPRYQPPAGDSSARPEAEVGLSRDLTGIGTVMLVEDDDPVRIFGARALRNKGYTVIEAKSGEAALELIRSGAHKIDLLITDVVMPRLDGPGLIREVREIYPTIKVIFISGYAEDAFRQRLDRDSDIEFLPKPFSLKQLAGKVKEVMNDVANEEGAA
ncbi:MAG TPA: PAS domain-containing protein [Stellaceae bacterium]|nr:PAS domain-containing protein [Stellaceae bacterium]